MAQVQDPAATTRAMSRVAPPTAEPVEQGAEPTFRLLTVRAHQGQLSGDLSGRTGTCAARALAAGGMHDRRDPRPAVGDGEALAVLGVGFGQPMQLRPTGQPLAHPR